MQILTFFAIVAVVVIVALFVFYKVPAINALFKDAETLFLPFVQAIGSAVVGALGFFNWGPLASLVQSTGITMGQVIGIAVVSFLQAVGMWIARQARDPSLKG